ncbi:MAG: ATP12 family protein [Pseudomonadota bacterium]
MKRFYKTAQAVETDSGWAVALDGRTVKTPARADLALEERALADALAAEWNAQGETVDVAGMHLTRLVNVAIDRTPQERDGMIDEVARYCETDLLCFLAGEDQAELRTRQVSAWRPIREWAGRAMGVVLMEAPAGTLHQPQPPASLDAARDHVRALDDLKLTAFLFGMGIYGSALLMLAVEQGETSSVEAYDLSILDEVWQAEKWGQDDEAEARHAARRAEIRVLEKIFQPPTG